MTTFKLNTLIHATCWILLITLLTSCFKYQDVEVKSVQNVRVKKFSKKGIEVEINMRLFNPNNYRISVVDSDLDVFIGNNNMGKAKIKGKVVLPKKTEKEHVITVVADFKDVSSMGLTSLISIFSNSSLDLRVKGEIKGRAMLVSRKFPVDFSERIQL